MTHLEPGTREARDAHSTSFRDVEQLGLYASIASLSWVFWVCGGMEMVERLAYYGVKAVATLYAKAPQSAGGLGVDLAQFGVLLLLWALVQSALPVFTGGLSDRYGYKETIFASTVLKIAGYATMAINQAFAKQAGIEPFWGFALGAIILAAGTAVFKPGIQGTLVKATDRRNSSMAWGIFYQTVNIGGFLGPLVAGLLRKMEWTWVFVACALIICLNFVLLLSYREVGKAERIERARQQRSARAASLVADSLRELAKPHVWVYLLVFSGFWFMFNALFDVLPAHIDDWVDTEDIIRTLFPGGQSHNPVVNFFVITNAQGTAIQPEGMLNINAGLIMLSCFFFAWAGSRMRATTSMTVGTLLASAAMFISGHSMLGWASVAAIATFSVGEMLSSPKFSEFIGNIAPHDKKAMYLGFSQLPLAIGWSLEGYFGLKMYERFASKDRFARELLSERMRDGAATLPGAHTLDTWAQHAHTTAVALTELAKTPSKFVDAIPNGEAFAWLAQMTGANPHALTRLLHDSHHVGLVWTILGGVGVVSALGIWLYGKWILRLEQRH